VIGLTSHKAYQKTTTPGTGTLAESKEKYEKTDQIINLFYTWCTFPNKYIFTD